MIHEFLEHTGPNTRLATRMVEELACNFQDMGV